MRLLSIAVAAAAPALLAATFLVGAIRDEEEFRWGILSPVVWVRLLYVGNTIVGAAGVWQLCRVLQVTPIVRGVTVLTYLLATRIRIPGPAPCWWTGRRRRCRICRCMPTAATIACSAGT